MPCDGPRVARASTFSYKGSSGPYTYKIGFAGQPNGLKATGDICYAISGSSCGSGFSIVVAVSGTFTWRDEALNLAVAGGSVHGGSFSVSGMVSELKIGYTVVRQTDESKVDADPPTLRIPFSFEAPLCDQRPLGWFAPSSGRAPTAKNRACASCRGAPQPGDRPSYQSPFSSGNVSSSDGEAKRTS